MEQETDHLALAEIYRFLAQSLRYPDTTWCHATYLDTLFQFLQALGCHDLMLDLENAVPGRQDFLKDLQIEYTRLFINAVPHVPAPPYASLYVKNSGQLFGAFAEEIQRFYREMGFELTDTAEPPDHIVHVLEFAALLLQEHSARAEEFIGRFLKPWVPHFCKQARESTTNSYYRIILLLLDFFTREEQQYVIESYAT